MSQSAVLRLQTAVHMTATIQVIDPNPDTLRVERVFIHSSGELRATVSGVECCIGTKEALVQAGLVMFEPVDARLARQRPVFSEMKVGGCQDRLWCVATDARLVNAAARFNVLKSTTGRLTEQQLWP